MSPSNTKEQITKAAAAEIIARGYAGTSLSAIATRLGLTKGALAHHFPSKADFAHYFVEVVRTATEQARTYSKQEYPSCGSRRLLLYFLIMGNWRTSDPHLSAGMALFADPASPAFESDNVIEDWLDLSTEAFALCQNTGDISPELTPIEAAELFLVANLGASIYQKHVRAARRREQPLMYVRFTLAGLGNERTRPHAEEVISKYGDRLPTLIAPR